MSIIGELSEYTNSLFGDFDTEKQAANALDSFLDKCNLFHVCKEVPGIYLHPRVMTEEKGSRIDRILVPKKEAISRGWSGGVIGIEVKKSGGTIGPAITQAMDYTRCCFDVNANILVVPMWVFVFPMKNPYQAAESIMTNHRIGQAYEMNGSLRLTVGTFIALEMQKDGSISILKTPNCGNRRGHRSPITR